MRKMRVKKKYRIFGRRLMSVLAGYAALAA
jgi:hypothetical protein